MTARVMTNSGSVSPAWLELRMVIQHPCLMRVKDLQERIASAIFYRKEIADAMRSCSLLQVIVGECSLRGNRAVLYCAVSGSRVRLSVHLPGV
jgi:hypothetical protein